MNRFRLYNPPLIVEQHTRYKWSGEGRGVSREKLKMNAECELLLVLTLLQLVILD